MNEEININNTIRRSAKGTRFSCVHILPGYSPPFSSMDLRAEDQAEFATEEDLKQRRGNLEKQGMVEMRESVGVCLAGYDGERNELNFDSEFPAAFDKGNGFRRRYSRTELEALRYADIQEQQMRWNETYIALEPSVAQELDEISLPNQKRSQKKADRQQLLGKKDAAGVFGTYLYFHNKQERATMDNTILPSMKFHNILPLYLSYCLLQFFALSLFYTEPMGYPYIPLQRLVGCLSAYKIEGQWAMARNREYLMHLHFSPSKHAIYVNSLNGSLRTAPSEPCYKFEGIYPQKKTAKFFQGVDFDELLDVGEGSSPSVEAYSGEDDSDGEYENIQRPAFLVQGEPDFESGPPQDGLEYLRRVRWEAAHIPKVKVAKLDKSKLNSEQTVYMPSIADIAKCPEQLLPSKQWEDAFLADFSELRQVLSSLESFNVGSFHGQPSPSVVNAGLAKIPGDPCETDRRPTSSVILGMDAVTRASVLRGRIGALETASRLSRDECLWIFALSAAVDAPLDAEMSASLRSLLRKCASLRAGKSEPDDEVMMLNILVTVSGKFFGQSEN
ncbi:hypothetical protein ACLOJK_011917 [Asimina triloba]